MVTDARKKDQATQKFQKEKVEEGNAFNTPVSRGGVVRDTAPTGMVLVCPDFGSWKPDEEKTSARTLREFDVFFCAY